VGFIVSTYRGESLVWKLERGVDFGLIWPKIIIIVIIIIVSYLFINEETNVQIEQ